MGIRRGYNIPDRACGDWGRDCHGRGASKPVTLVAPFNCPVLLSPPGGSEGTLGSHILHLMPCCTSDSAVCLHRSPAPSGGISFPLKASCLPQHTRPLGLSERPPEPGPEFCSGSPWVGFFAKGGNARECCSGISVMQTAPSPNPVCKSLNPRQSTSQYTNDFTITQSAFPPLGAEGCWPPARR